MDNINFNRLLKSISNFTNTKVKHEGSIYIISFECKINNIQTQFRALVSDEFPESEAITCVCLNNHSIRSIPPHIFVTADNWYNICYLNKEKVIIDYSDPAELLKFYLLEAVRTVREGLSEKNKGDYPKEFLSYIIASENYSDKNMILINYGKRGQFANLKAQNISDSTYLYDNYDMLKKFTTEKPLKDEEVGLLYDQIIYIPLSNNNIVIPNDNIWSLSFIRQFITNNLENSAANIYRASINSRIKNSCGKLLIICSIDNGRFDAVFIIELNIYCKESYYTHPLKHCKYNTDIRLLIPYRMDKEYILPRGTSLVSLQNRRVLLFGCGAVGGNVAVELAKSGIEYLTLVDNDWFYCENIYRNVMGLDSILNVKGVTNSSKVQLLKRDIESKYPYINVQAEQKTIQQILKTEPDFFEQFDLVISVTGDITEKLRLNQFVHKNKIHTPIIFGWVEAFGIDG